MRPLAVLALTLLLLEACAPVPHSPWQSGFWYTINDYVASWAILLGIFVIAASLFGLVFLDDSLDNWEVWEDWPGASRLVIWGGLAIGLSLVLLSVIARAVVSYAQPY